MTTEPQYANFWERFGAYILDALIIGIPAYFLNYLNFETVRSFYFYLPLALVSLLYKPFMESKYQATLGKMIVDLKVTGQNFEQIGFEKSLVRSAIFILPALFYIPVQYVAYENPNLMEMDSFWDFSQAVAVAYPLMTVFNCLFSLVVLADLIALLSDETKKQRSLKDRLAKTYVIRAK